MLAFVPQATREIAEAAIQFHGGIGLTWEYPLNRYLRRIVRLGTSLGSATQHRRAALSCSVAKGWTIQQSRPRHANGGRHDGHL